MGSAIWRPIRCTGLRAWSAPWNTIAALVQRTARSSPGRMVSTSLPSRRISPSYLVPAGSRRRMALASVVLPQPDSPASPSEVPAGTSKLTPRTAGTGCVSAW